MQTLSFAALEIVKDMHKLQSNKMLYYILFPITMWYGIVVALRNLLFDLGLRTQEAPHVTTIGVGNLVCGGAGKTPMVEYLVRLFADSANVAILSRGYKRSSKGYVRASADACEASLLGDEPAMMYRKFPGITVAVCEKRVEGLRNLLASDNPPSLVLMDDVYQHRQVKPTVNILLTEYDHPYFKDRILPYGTLREFRKAAVRANIIVVTKSPKDINPIVRHTFLSQLGVSAHQQVYFAHIEYGTPVALYGAGSMNLDNVDSVLAVTGIAHPQPLLDYLNDERHTVSHLSFPDHHDFTADDVARIVEAYNALPGSSKVIVTTEKDAERLRKEAAAEQLRQLSVYMIPITMAFNEANGETFDNTVKAIVRENTTFISRLTKSNYNL